MKKTMLTFLLSLLLVSFNLTAQNWLTTGNALSANGTLGSTTNFSVLFKSNNSERGRLTNSGLWGFGTTAPSSKVHINSASGQIPFRVQVNASTKFLVHSGGGVSIGSGSTPPANGLYVSGNVGIGTATPSKKLQVTGKSLFTDSLVVSDGGINVTNKKGYGVSSTGVGYGLYCVGTSPDPSVATYGVVASGTTGVYGVGSKTGSFGTGSDYGVYGTATGFQGTGVYGVAQPFGVYGKATDLFNGVGVYGTGPLYGVRGSSTQGTGIYGETGNANAWAGYFSGKVYSSGGYTSSDRKLKKNISDMNSAMDIINKLKPKEYEFRQDGNYKLMNLPQGKHFGLIAQEVEEVLPNVVADAQFDPVRMSPQNKQVTTTGSPVIASTAHSEDKAEIINFKTLNYTELIPLLVKAVQEQDAENKTLRQENKEIKERLAKLETQLSVNNVLPSNFSYLEQNKPNPFTKNTIIRYNIPQGSKGQINIYDQTGKLIKALKANDNGHTELNGYDLAAGMYAYTLMINGKVALSRQMLIIK